MLADLLVSDRPQGLARRAYVMCNHFLWVHVALIFLPSLFVDSLMISPPVLLTPYFNDKDQ